MSFRTHEAHDFLLELLRKLGETLRAAITQVTRGLDLDDVDDAALADAELELELERALMREFGALHERLERLHPSGVVGMLRPRSRARAYATLLGYRALVRGHTSRTQELEASRLVAIARARDAPRALRLLLDLYDEERGLERRPATPIDLTLVRALLCIADEAALDDSVRRRVARLPEEA